jgi:hypothetical protein
MERVINSVAIDLQQKLHLEKCHPEPEDIYLGAHIKQANLNCSCLITANNKHFPKPVFSKIGYILLESQKETQVLSIIQ